MADKKGCSFFEILQKGPALAKAPAVAALWRGKKTEGRNRQRRIRPRFRNQGRSRSIKVDKGNEHCLYGFAAKLLERLG
jgi:hypothetical protein